jgi:hypothetical protein
VRKPKNKEGKDKQGFKPEQHVRTVSPSPMVFGRKQPEALKREYATQSQKDGFEDIIIYGPDNAFPLRLALAVDESPAASACIETITKFIKGSGFSDPELQNIPVDNSGTTLWDFHCGLAETIATFWGFAVNFKFARNGKIDQSFQTSFECCRFAMPPEKDPNITQIRHNPYYGTAEYRQEYTTTYSVFDVKKAAQEISDAASGGKGKLESYQGQIYYYGKTSPLSRFYPKPKYWSAKEAIQADHKLQEFHNQELENGFFQSVLINAIGDPNLWSKNPRLQKDDEKTDGTKIKVATKTVGEEFNDQMSTAFSGSSKAGTAMVLWSSNSDTAIKLQEFPTGINGDRIIATQDSVTKTITIAFQVPSILANISEGVSLGSGGSEIQKAIELMQSRTVEWREVLQNFYNNILLPNLNKRPKGEVKVEIQNYNPISQPVEVNKEIWAFLNEQEKVAFIKKNMPEVEMFRADPAALPVTPAPTPIEGQDPVEGQPVQTTAAPTQSNPAQDAIDALIRGLSRKDLSKFWGYVNDYKNGRATLEQAKVFLRAYKLTDEQIMLFLNDPENDGPD